MLGLWVLLAVCLDAVAALEVKTPIGRLTGRTLRSREGREYAAFTRVPFASPPVGNRRFTAPDAGGGSWTGVLDATQPSPACYQSGQNGYIGQEDCLYLNIYTPKVNGSLAVLVYIYGGGWRNGFPGPSSVSKFFMDEDVVLVMPNYRLGPFGFLSTEDDEIPGNVGLKDMATAIEWTRSYIEHFGGDPNSITAFGLSAGGASTHYLCSALRTRALLKGCISESGVGGNFWSLAKPGSARTNAFKVANSVGCFGDGLLQCLQSKQPEEIIRTENILRFWTGEPLIIYGPVLEVRKEGGLISEWPTDSDFPWITGITSAEGKLKSGALSLYYSNKSYADEFYLHKEEYLIKMLNLNEVRRDSAMKVYKRFFTNDDFLSGMEKLYSEVYFIHPVLKELKSHTGPKYFYVFNYTEGPDFWELHTGNKPNLTSHGASHGENFYYFFNTSEYLPGYKELQPKDVQLSKDLIKLWVNFAKHQRPSPEENPLWKPFGEKNSYLYIGHSEMSMKEYLNVEEILNFWKEIF